MEENENLEMSLFNSDQPLELNFDDMEEFELDEDTEDTTDEEEVQEETSEESEENENNDLGEGDDSSSEDVAEEEDQDEEGSESDDDSPAIYSSFASVLAEKGLLPSLDLDNAEIKSIDDLTTAFKGEIDNQVKSYLVEKLGEQGYEAIEKGVSLQEYQRYQEDVNVLDGITPDMFEQDLELAKRVILQDYISQGIEEKRAMRLLKKTIDLGEDSILEDATESLDSLKAIQQVKLQKLQEERAAERQKQLELQEKIDNDLKNTIYNSEEFIKGMKVTKEIKDKVYKGITQIVGKSPDGIAENKLMRDRRENPIEFDTKLYYLYEVTNGFQDFSKIVSKSQTSAVSKLEKQLRKNKFEDSGKPSFIDDPESYGGLDLGSELVL